VRIGGGRILVRTLEDGVLRKITTEELWNNQPIRKSDELEIHEAMVSGVTPSTIYLMLMDGSYRFLETPRRGLDAEPGDRVRILLYHGNVFVLGKLESEKVS